MEPSTQATENLANRRQEFESRFDDLHRALDRELGWAPTAKTWVLTLAAFAAGAALAAWLTARSRREKRSASRGQGSLEDHGEVVGGAALEVD